MSLLSNRICSYLNDSKSEMWWPGLAEFIISNSEHHDYPAKNYSTASLISSKKAKPAVLIPISTLSDAKLEFLCDSHAQLFAQQSAPHRLHLIWFRCSCQGKQTFRSRLKARP